jgi:hypothetical protein
LRAPSGDTGGACGTLDCLTRDAPAPTITAVAISREPKKFTDEIVRSLKDIGISLFACSIYDLRFAFQLQADRQRTTDRRRMQCSLRCVVTTSPKHETADPSSGQGWEDMPKSQIAGRCRKAKRPEEKVSWESLLPGIPNG